MEIKLYFEQKIGRQNLVDRMFDKKEAQETDSLYAMSYTNTLQTF